MKTQILIILCLLIPFVVSSQGLNNWVGKEPPATESPTANPTQSTNTDKKMERLDFVNSIYSALPTNSNCPVRFIIGPASATQPAAGDMNHVVAAIQGYCVTPNNMILYMGSKCTLLGESSANAALSRINVAIYLVSCVRDDGTTWQYPDEINKSRTIGYLTGIKSREAKDDNYVGIEAKRITDKEKYVWIKSMLDLLAMFSIARAEAEVSENLVSSSNGQSISLNKVDGDKNIYAAGKGVGEGIIPGFQDLVRELYNEARGYLIIESNVKANVFYLESIDISGLTEKIRLSNKKFEHFAL